MVITRGGNLGTWTPFPGFPAVRASSSSDQQPAPRPPQPNTHAHAHTHRRARTAPPCPCRLWRYGLGLHLIKGKPVPRSSCIDPKSDHLSFQVPLGPGRAGWAGQWALACVSGALCEAPTCKFWALGP